MGTTTKRAALYLRQSLDRGEGIEAQRQRCTVLAESRGWPIIDTFVDNETRASKPRGADTDWARMLPRIGRDFEVIVSVDIDRLLRSTKDLLALVDLGAQVVTVDGEIDLTGADGKFRATMLAGIAEFETGRASERQKRHKADRAAKGKWHGGTPPYGYQLDPDTKNLVPNEKEKALVLEVATRLLDRGQSMHSIVVDWNSRGITTRKGNHWRQPNLRSIMLSRSLLGRTSANVSGWEPIMDERRFDRLTALLTDPSRKVTQSPGVKGGKYSMGGGLTVCGICGGTMITHSKAIGKGKDTSTPTLACLARMNDSPKHKTVNRVSIAHAPLEEYVFEQVTAALKDTERWKARMAEKDPAIDARLDELDSRRTSLNEQRLNAGRAFTMGAFSDRELAAEVARIRQELEAVNDEYNKLVGKPMVSAILQEGKLENWREWSPLDRRTFLKLFIDRIEVHPFPALTARNAGWKRGETDEQIAVRQAKHAERMKVATASRIKIVWKWEQ